MFRVALFSGPTSCTQTQCSWLIPAHVASLTYRPLAEMDFSSAKRKRKDFEVKVQEVTPTSASAVVAEAEPETAERETTPVASSMSARKFPEPPSASETDMFYQTLSCCGHKPVVLSLISPYSDAYVNDTRLTAQPLTSLYRDGNLTFTLAELQTLAETVDYSISLSDSESIELATRGQSKNQTWFNFRAGRVTASKFKAVCSTNTSTPSKSLLRSICYPDSNKFKSVATEWGLAHEKVALEKYAESMSGHENFFIEECGFIINPDYPWMGASPDSLVSCQCCGLGTVEVKCPYKLRDKSIPEYLSCSDCIEEIDEEFKLKVRHQYYFQVQAQMFACNVDYCDFVVCTFADSRPNIFVSRILRDDQFWSIHSDQALSFFRLCILPEVLGRSFTRPLCIE